MAYRLMRYEVGVLDGQVVLTLQYATSVDTTSSIHRNVLRVALPPEGAMRAAMGLLEATRGLLFDEPVPEPVAKH